MAFLGLALALSAVTGASTGADAKGKNKGKDVDIDKVLGACDRTAGCFYGPSGPGIGVGCSPVTCFECNHFKCHAIIKGNTKGTDLGGIRLPRGSVQSVSGTNSGAENTKPIRHPVKVGPHNPSASAKFPTSFEKGGGSNRDGRRH